MSIDNTDLTGGEVAGSGFFDELMRTSKAHLQEEYNAGRITGADYGTVYLGVMQSNLQTATQFLLQRDLTNKQLLLIQEQIDKAKQDVLLTIAQVRNVEADTNIKIKQLDIMDEQILQIKAQVELTNSQKLQVDKNIEVADKQIEQITAQISLTEKQEDMVDKQILTETANTTLPTGGISLATYNKAVAEQELLVQRKATETAQTVGTLDSDGNSSIGGVLGAQVNLYEKQKEGFLRDAEQKAAKLMSDSFSVVHSLTPGGANSDPNDWNLGSADSEKVIAKLAEGIGVTI